jgi:hypothetical protein
MNDSRALLWTAEALLVLAVVLPGCHREEQAVTTAASKATTAEQRAQATSAERDRQRAQLAKVALPVKSRYVDVHEPGAWSNPFISIDTQMINLRITMADANPSQLGAGGLLRPSAARRQELQVRQSDLVEALIALPPGAWPYGRVVAIEESPLADRNARPAIRRQMEQVIKQLNDLGVVVDEWPER